MSYNYFKSYMSLNLQLLNDYYGQKSKQHISSSHFTILSSSVYPVRSCLTDGFPNIWVADTLQCVCSACIFFCLCQCSPLLSSSRFPGAIRKRRKTGMEIFTTRERKMFSCPLAFALGCSFFVHNHGRGGRNAQKHGKHFFSLFS